MGKKVSGKRGRAGGSGEGTTEAWTSSDHAVRKAKQQRKAVGDKQVERERRTALLTRGSKQKREEGKLRLHIKRVNRQIEKLRERLEAWDEEEERKLAQKLLDEQKPKPKKKKGRLGPETWKLKGAARPAWQVYDFDIRYVDPHLKAHEDAKKKAQRVVNIFSVYKGRFGEEANGIPQPQCREFLSLLMQLGNLSLQINQLKSARQAFLECMDLDSAEEPITPARCQLMKLYLDANRPESARRLWERLPSNDPSVWIRYSAALIEFVSWKILEESGSSKETAEALLTSAIQANVYCAYYLAFSDTFDQVMEYTEDIEDATDDQPLEEAIEYCNHEQGMGAWHGTDGSLEWIKSVILRTLQDANETSSLSPKDLEWKEGLASIKEEYEAAEKDRMEDEASQDSNDADESEEEESEAGKVMFAGMFETAMEMLEDNGDLKRS